MRGSNIISETIFSSTRGEVRVQIRVQVVLNIRGQVRIIVVYDSTNRAREISICMLALTLFVGQIC